MSRAFYNACLRIPDAKTRAKSGVCCVRPCAGQQKMRCDSPMEAAAQTVITALPEHEQQKHTEAEGGESMFQALHPLAVFGSI